MISPRIVVLDGFTLSPLAVGETSPDHPSWSALASFGDLQVHARTAAQDVIDRAAGAPVVFTNKVVLGARELAALPDLRFIGVMATGTNVVDLPEAQSRGITVTNVPGYSTMSVAQHVFALLLELAGRTGPTAAAVRAGAWESCPDFCFSLGPTRELAGKSLGLIGLGAIGQAVAAIGHALGMKILVYSRTRKDSPIPMDWADSPEEIFSSVDVVSLHCPLVPETRHMVNSARLSLMKPGAWLINTSRGPLVDEDALAAALHAGTLAGFAADVLAVEPPAPGHPLIKAPNTVITPHLAWASVEARHRLMDVLVANLKGWLNGRPVNVVG